MPTAYISEASYAGSPSTDFAEVAVATGTEVLVPAKALLGMRGVRQMRGRTRMLWHHFSLASHQVVRVNGAWTESLLLGPMVVNGLPRHERKALRALFPTANGGPLNGPSARPCLMVRQTRELLNLSAIDQRIKWRCQSQPA